MLEEFKKFIMRGNVVDLAVGVIIGGAFGGIVTSLVNDVIMPPIGLLVGGSVVIPHVRRALVAWEDLGGRPTGDHSTSDVEN